MGRRKISIKPITDERNRAVTFNKRRAGLFKKAYELGTLCGADIAVIIFSPTGKCYEYSSANLDETLLRYSRMIAPPAERKGPLDYGGMTARTRNTVDDEADAEDEEDEEDRSADDRHSAASNRTEVRPESPDVRYSVSHTGHAPPSIQAAFGSTYTDLRHFRMNPIPSMSVDLADRSVSQTEGPIEDFSRHHRDPAALSGPMPPLVRSVHALSAHEVRPRATSTHPDLASLRRGSAPILPTSSREYRSFSFEGSRNLMSEPPEHTPAFSVDDMELWTRPRSGSGGMLHAAEDDRDTFEWPTYERRPSGTVEGQAVPLKRTASLTAHETAEPIDKRPRQ